jgi:aminopeptidase N
VGLDLEEKISDATTDKYLYIDSIGTYDFEEALMTLNVTSVTDSAFVRVVHNWVYPDPPKTVIPGLHISQERYWLVDGVWPQGFNANATILYNGTASTSGGYLDNQLITNNEDSLVVLYRASPAADWAIDSNTTLMVQGSATNKKGYFIINQIKKGEYTLAIWDHSRADSNVVLDNTACTLLGINSPKAAIDKQLTIVPNPANDSFRIQLPNPATSVGDLLIYDVAGRELKHLQMQAGEQQKVISANDLSKGTYLVVWQSKTTKLTGHLVIVK